MIDYEWTEELLYGILYTGNRMTDKEGHFQIVHKKRVMSRKESAPDENCNCNKETEYKNCRGRRVQERNVDAAPQVQNRAMEKTLNKRPFIYRPTYLPDMPPPLILSGSLGHGITLWRDWWIYLPLFLIGILHHLETRKYGIWHLCFKCQ